MPCKRDEQLTVLAADLFESRRNRIDFNSAFNYDTVRAFQFDCPREAIMKRRLQFVGLILLGSAAMIAIGCRNGAFHFDPVDMIFPDKRPLHKQYPADEPDWLPSRLAPD